MSHRSRCDGQFQPVRQKSFAFFCPFSLAKKQQDTAGDAGRTHVKVIFLVCLESEEIKIIKNKWTRAKDRDSKFRQATDCCQWKLSWEPTSLVSYRLRRRMSTSAAVSWMCLSVARFLKCESRSVESSTTLLLTSFLQLIPV